ncbi:Alpha/Beta hydrolase protein [Thamnocephalis sphaerospora]|uniref:Carboxypeptidase n=1 Tax=Thamnocephalis sphaerospora TaxID=78915 RepID=A0A4P9XJH4_9FUNG|nr:Alpha/Beta hydrolase protein [Thamnocephalis sphaerospora]|eukprot:RKP05913.1 Alpha/Beta hydrolase protein [Thamnocephalis sphaerospora]
MRQVKLLSALLLLLAVPACSARRSTHTTLRQTIFQQTTVNDLLPDVADGSFEDLTESDTAFDDLVENNSPAELFSVPPGAPIKTLREEDDSTVLMLSNLPGYSLTFKQPKLCDTSVRQYSGYLNVDSDKHFFFWFFESRTSPAKDPLMMWLNGGPGCSSLLGLFMELGPCMINPDGNGTHVNQAGWNTKSNVIFLDQPLNVGYSYGTGVSNSEDAAKDVYAFMQLFYTAFPRFQQHDFHLFGESYGGHYVPAIGDEIRRNNKGAQADGYHVINLKSIGIGNGLTDPLVQYKYYGDMACKNSFLSKEQCASMDAAYPTCARLINLCYRFPSSFACVPPAAYCNKQMLEPYVRAGYNPYDVRVKCDPSTPLCYSEITAITKYLNLPHVMRELGAKVSKFDSCNTDINRQFMMAGDWMRPYVRKVPKILEAGIRVLVYAGDADFICNWMGNKAWTIEMEWAGKSKFSATKDQPWTVDGIDAGEVREVGPLTFLRVYKAGHMVPYDQPANSLDMINRWLAKESFLN